MAIWGTTDEGELKKLNDNDIKKEIIKLTGWDNIQYNKEYYRFRNKIRNYDTISGAKKFQRPNETMLRILRRQSEGAELTAYQKGVLNTTSAFNTTIKKQIENNSLSYNQFSIVLEGIKAEFEQLINSVPRINREYNDWLNEVVGKEIFINEKGEPEEKDILRSSIVTPKELKDYLIEQASKMHDWQTETLKANTAYYQNDKRKLGYNDY